MTDVFDDAVDAGSPAPERSRLRRCHRRRRYVRRERHTHVPWAGRYLGPIRQAQYQQLQAVPGRPSAWWRQQLDRDSDPTRTEFRDAIDRATPNSGHYALAELEGLGVLKHTITQNVDDLHRKAGSSSVTEIHGNRTKLRCVGCESRWPRDEFPIRRYPPRCPECGDYVKVGHRDVR